MSAEKQKEYHQTGALPTFWDVVMADIDNGGHVTSEDMVRYYDEWAIDGCYEKSVATHGYEALNVLQKTMEGLYPDPKERSNITILEVAVCTGFTGQRLHQMGFRKIDGLDPSTESLRVAEQKGVFRQLYNVYITGDPLDIPPDSYDAVVMVGAMGPKHVPPEAFTEMIRLVKPGGYIVNLTRADFLDRCSEYVNHWKPVVESHVTAGRWQVLRDEPYECHFLDRPGHLHVFRIC